jgi:predicted GIY-YIG superfamily endonuclease
MAYTDTGYTYVGMTIDIDERTEDHKSNVRHGRLGSCKILPTKDIVVIVLETIYSLSKSDALIVESRYIVWDKLTNPKKNCNTNLGHSNTFESE